MQIETTTRRCALIALLALASLGIPVTTASAQRASASAYTASSYETSGSRLVAAIDDQQLFRRVPRRELYVVAHPDDDLLFISPTISRSLEDPETEVHIV